MEIKRRSTQPSAKGPAETFTGSVRIDPLFQSPTNDRRLPRLKERAEAVEPLFGFVRRILTRQAKSLPGGMATLPFEQQGRNAAAAWHGRGCTELHVSLNHTRHGIPQVCLETLG